MTENNGEKSRKMEVMGGMGQIGLIGRIGMIRLEAKKICVVLRIYVTLHYEQEDVYDCI